jgi:multidrug resistance efflux pump
MSKNILYILFIAFLATNCSQKEESATEKVVVAPESDILVGIGKIIPEQQIIQVAAQSSGVLQTIFKQENETFQKGEVLAVLSNAVEANEVEEAIFRSNIQNQEVKVAQATLAEYEAKFLNAQNLYNRLKSLYDKGAETKQTLENAETEYKSLQANITRLKSQLAIAQARLSSSNSNTSLYEAKLDKTKIIAPSDGKVLEWKIRPGEGITAQQTIAQIAPTGNTIVECEIDESLAFKVKVGQSVEVNYLGAAEVIGKGKIYFLSEYLRKKSMFSEQSGEAEDRRVRVVKVMLENPQGLLFNAKVEVKISAK